jgi:hypothetical protein
MSIIILLPVVVSLLFKLAVVWYLRITASCTAAILKRGAFSNIASNRPGLACVWHGLVLGQKTSVTRALCRFVAVTQHRAVFGWSASACALPAGVAAVPVRRPQRPANAVFGGRCRLARLGPAAAEQPRTSARSGRASCHAACPAQHGVGASLHIWAAKSVDT